MERQPFVSRVQIENFRSIASCDVELGPLMFIVGRNGSGKSNFLDAFRFVSEALRQGLQGALEDRSGLRELSRRSKSRPFDLRISFNLNLSDGSAGWYSLTLGSAKSSKLGYKVKAESCRVGGLFGPTGESSEFSRSDTRIEGLVDPPAVIPEALYLTNVSGRPAFGLIYEELRKMSFYNLVPSQMRSLAPRSESNGLLRDGRNLASSIGRMESEAGARLKRLEEYMSKILPGLKGIRRKVVDRFETLEFEQDDWKFNAGQMSDGTLRATGVLAAVLGQHGAPLIGLEEPEIALHPAAFGLLRDALKEGAEESQILVTSQSPELLDDPDLKAEQILSTKWEQGQTRIGPINEAEAGMLRDDLVTAGELLRQSRLEPEN
ncbi:MAG: AAA family ATPase [Terriglobales bacterium]